MNRDKCTWPWFVKENRPKTGERLWVLCQVFSHQCLKIRPQPRVFAGAQLKPSDTHVHTHFCTSTPPLTISYGKDEVALMIV